MDLVDFPTTIPYLLARVADDSNQGKQPTDDDPASERFAGAIVSGLVVFALFTLALVYLLCRHRRGGPQLSSAETLHSTPLEWEPPPHSTHHRDSIACLHGRYEDRTTSSPIRSGYSSHDPTAPRPHCWACSSTQRDWQPPTLRPDRTTIGLEDHQLFNAVGAYHADDYDPSSALVDQPPASQTFRNHSNQVIDGAVAEVAAGAPPIRTHTQASGDPTIQVAAPGQVYSTRHTAITPDSSSNARSSTHRQGRPRDIAGRLSVILQSLDSLVEEIQGEEGVSVTAPEELTSLQRLRDGLEVIRGESAVLQGNRTSREASDAPVAGLTGRRHRSASRTPDTDRVFESVNVGDGRIPRPWVMT